MGGTFHRWGSSIHYYKPTLDDNYLQTRFFTAAPIQNVHRSGKVDFSVDFQGLALEKSNLCEAVPNVCAAKTGYQSGKFYSYIIRV